MFYIRVIVKIEENKFKNNLFLQSSLISFAITMRQRNIIELIYGVVNPGTPILLPYECNRSLGSK